jgi:excisionase family DNA binding protein
MTAPEDPLTTAEVARLLRTSRRQVQRELATGRLKGVRHGHGWRVTRLEVWRYLEIEQAMLDLWLAHRRQIEGGTPDPASTPPRVRP